MAVYLGTNPVSVYNGGQNSIRIEEKTVTPGTSNIEVLPSEGKYLSKVVVQGDEDLIAENIKSGVNIFGQVGTLEGGKDTDFSLVTATPSDVLNNKQFYDSNGEIVSGTGTKNGKYAWKVGTKKETSTTQSIDVRAYETGTHTFTASISTSGLTEQDFYNLVLRYDGTSESNYITLNSDNTADFISGTTWPSGQWEYNTSDKELILTNISSSIPSGSYYGGSINKTTTTTTIVYESFIIDDNSNTYPTNGVQKGKQYLKLNL